MPLERVERAANQVVAGLTLANGHAVPGGEQAHHLGAQVGGKASQLAHHEKLALAMFGDRARKIVVGRHAGDLDALALEHRAHLLAGLPVQVHRVAVRPLAVKLDAVVAKVLGALDGVLERERGSVVPDAQVGHAVKTDLHGG